MSELQTSKLSPNPLHTATAEEVRHGDTTEGVKRVWNAISADKYSFSLRGIPLRPAQAPVLWIHLKCKLQTQIQE